MDPSSTPTMEANPRAYLPRYSMDDTISLSSTISDGFSETDSFIYNPSLASSQTSIASYKTENSITSRKSRNNALPRRKYAGCEHARAPFGHVLSDVEDDSDFEVCRTIKCRGNHNDTSVIFQTESDEDTNSINTIAERDVVPVTTAPLSVRTTSNRAPVNPTPDPRFLSGSTDSVRNAPSTSSSSVSHTKFVPVSRSTTPKIPPQPPNSSFARIPADRSAEVPESSARRGADVVNDRTRTHISGPSISGFEPNTIADTIPVVERRAPSNFSGKPITPLTAGSSFTNTAGPSSSRAHQSNPSTSAFEPESDIDDIVQTVERSVNNPKFSPFYYSK